MGHICSVCDTKWDCCYTKERCCKTILTPCSKCLAEKRKEKPDPCDCDNCEFLRRFGYTSVQMKSDDRDITCSYCLQLSSQHDGYHCPVKTEWELECGAKVKMMDSHSFEILVGAEPGRVDVTEIPSLIKILEEIKGRKNAPR